jgi:glycosyltransferase involved in cell wall biosynthesis
MTAGLRVAVVGNTDHSLLRFRLPLLRALVRRGADVHAVAPPGPSRAALEAEGMAFVPCVLSRGSLNPVQELLTVLSLLRIYRRLRPGVAHHFTVKPNIYGAFAARLAGVPVVVASVTGLGYVYTGDDLLARLLRPLVSLLYRAAFMLSDAVTFQNPDDLDDLARAWALPTGKGRVVLGGSGVDTAHYDPAAVDPAAIRALRESLAPREGTAVVLLVARMLWHKGIGEFVEAARALRARGLDAQFVLVGPEDTGNPAAIPGSTLRQWVEEGAVQYLGERSDVRELMAAADVVALPSYREGTPRTLLEAAAMGKAMVASDAPGCREVVDHEATGLLVPPRDAGALAEAIERLLLSPDLRLQLGEAARRKAEVDFDESVVAARFLDLYDGLLRRKGLATTGG